MSIIERVSGWLRKESLAGASIAQYVNGQPVQTPRRYDALADEAYVKNVIAHRCVRLIAANTASVPWKLYKDEKEVKQHPLLDLLATPNPQRWQTYFLEEVISYLLLSGNSYIEATALLGSEPKELYTLRPDRMTVVSGKVGLPIAYEHQVNGVKVRYAVDPITGRSPICHLRLAHPLNDWYGLAPVEAAAYSIDQHNAAGLHNNSILNNSASPSGALIFNGAVDQARLEALEEKLREKFANPKKAGKPMVLSGAFDWKQFAISPKDLDFNEGKLQVAREICTAFGVPHLLIVPGQSTYNNVAEAKLQLWDDTIIPLLDLLRDGLMKWLAARYERERGLVLKYDLNVVSALAPRRQQQSDKILREWEAGLIRRNEARAMLGYDKDTKAGEDYSNSNFPQGAAKSAPRLERKRLEDLTFISDELDQPEIKFAVAALVEKELHEIVVKYGEDVAREIGERAAFEVTQQVNEYVRQTTGEMITNVNTTTKKLIGNAIKEALENRETFPDIEQRIYDIFKGAIADYRSRMIAVTESTHAAAYAANVAINQAGVEQKEWLATMDSYTRDTHAALDGQRVAADGWFESMSGDRAQFPGGFATGGENINCRCAVAAVFDKKDGLGNERPAVTWESREAKRLVAEKRLLAISTKIFTMQGDAVLKRMAQIHQMPQGAADAN